MYVATRAKVTAVGAVGAVGGHVNDGSIGHGGGGSDTWTSLCSGQFGINEVHTDDPKFAD